MIKIIIISSCYCRSGSNIHILCNLIYMRMHHQSLLLPHPQLSHRLHALSAVELLPYYLSYMHDGEEYRPPVYNIQPHIMSLLMHTHNILQSAILHLYIQHLSSQYVIIHIALLNHGILPFIQILHTFEPMFIYKNKASVYESSNITS